MARPEPAAGGDPRVEHFAGRAAAEGPHAAAYAACRAIREAVFVRGQGVPAELEWDGLDAHAEHFLLRWGVGAESDPAAAITPVGTARLRRVDDAAKAERVAVLEVWRGLGLGRRLMHALEHHARRQGLGEIRLHAQLPVVPFYEKLGYRAHGAVFQEAGLAHRAMTRHLDRIEV